MNVAEAVQAFLDGEKLQCKGVGSSGPFADCSDLGKTTLNTMSLYEWRLKPVPREFTLYHSKETTQKWFEAGDTILNYVNNPFNNYESIKVREVLED